MSSNNTRKKKRTRVVRSCTECKQVKLRCDAKDQFPRPCTRCVQRDLECIIDAEFRRMPARQHVDGMKRELRDIRRSMGQQQKAVPRATAEDTGCDSSNGGTPTPSLPSTSQIGFCKSPRSFEGIQPARLGECEVSAAEVNHIFSIFAIHFYYQLPILNPDITVAALQESEPFLFWTIVVIVCQRLPSTSVDRWQALVEPYQDLLRRAAFSSPLGLLTVQALLYICTWPLPVQYQARDQSWTLSGLATNAALYMGLNKPRHPPALRSIGVFGESPMRSITWLGCFYISTCTSQTIGLYPPLRSPEDLTTMARFLRDISVPKGFAALVDIERCVAKYTALVSEHPDPDAVQSIIQLFEHELDVTKSSYEDVWTVRIDFVFLTAKLYVYASLAVNEGRDLVSGYQRARRTATPNAYCTHLSQGLSAAVRVTYIMSSDACAALQAHPLADASPELSEQQLHLDGLPKFYFRALVFAAVYLLRYFALNGQCRPADRDLARSHVIMAYNYMQKHSKDPMDECGRAAAVIDALSSGGSTSQQINGMASLRVRERLGVSIFYDALTVANELRNKPVRLKSTKDDPQQRSDIHAPSTESPTGTRASPGDESSGGHQWDWISLLTPGMMEGFDLNFDLETFGVAEEPNPYGMLANEPRQGM